ncbi:hypothetical protein AAY473_000482 [Plecturocebus cupreus]
MLSIPSLHVCTPHNYNYYFVPSDLLLPNMGFHHDGQADHELLTSSDPPISASQSSRITAGTSTQLLKKPLYKVYSLQSPAKQLLKGDVLMLTLYLLIAKALVPYIYHMSGQAALRVGLINDLALSVTHPWWVGLQGSQVVLQSHPAAVVQHSFHSGQMRKDKPLVVLRAIPRRVRTTTTTTTTKQHQTHGEHRTRELSLPLPAGEQSLDLRKHEDEGRTTNSKHPSGQGHHTDAATRMAGRRTPDRTVLPHRASVRRDLLIALHTAIQ